jgi:V/A-type H+-transporting ATPase subunit K
MDATVVGYAAASAVLGLSAMGSALGAGVAGMAAVGAWKKCYAQDKTAPFILIAFVGAPLTQTIYGFILMGTVMKVAAAMAQAGAPLGQFMFLLIAGLFSGAAIGLSAVMQGKCGAAASDAMGETGKGFGNYIIVLGMTETVALFTMVFSMVVIGKLAG